MEETDSTITYVYGNFLYNIIHILLFVFLADLSSSKTPKSFPESWSFNRG